MDRWTLLERCEILDCSPWFKVFRDKVRLEDSKTIVPDFYLIEATSCVSIFALTVDHQVVLIEHYRYAVGRRVLDLPGGGIDADENPLDTAQRELREETGFEAQEWHPLGVFTVDGNRGYGQVFAFLALTAVRKAAPDTDDLGRQAVRLYTPSRLRTVWQAGNIPVLTAAATIGLGLAHLEARGIA